MCVPWSQEGHVPPVVPPRRSLFRSTVCVGVWSDSSDAGIQTPDLRDVRVWIPGPVSVGVRVTTSVKCPCLSSVTCATPDLLTTQTPSRHRYRPGIWYVTTQFGPRVTRHICRLPLHGAGTDHHLLSRSVYSMGTYSQMVHRSFEDHRVPWKRPTYQSSCLCGGYVGSRGTGPRQCLLTSHRGTWTHGNVDGE